jgi:hypothetical protein
VTREIYWLNVDRPTRTARVHIEGCQYVNEMLYSMTYRAEGLPKRSEDGAWLEFESLPALVEHALTLRRYTMTGCRRCFKRDAALDPKQDGRFGRG